MILREVRFAALDFESAGTAPGLADEPVQIGIASRENGQLRILLDSYLKPTRPVTWAAQSVHGIGDRELASAPRFVDLWPALKDCLRDRWIVAHGAGTERRFLRTFPLHGFGPWVDTLRLARHFFPGCGSYALGDLIGLFGLQSHLERPGFRWHDAASDAAACLVLLEHILDTAGLWNEPVDLFRELAGLGFKLATRESGKV
jgi:DNA polymerase-3 subunit epsilon